MNKNITIIIIGIIVVGSGSFYGGMMYAQNKDVTTSLASSQARQSQRGATGGIMRGTRNGGGFSAGQIISKDDKSITLKLQDGGSKIIFFTSTTPVTKSVDGSAQDLTIGKEAVITGTSNQDGSISAQSIQLRSALQK